jgi:hypothetical protein
MQQPIRLKIKLSGFDQFFTDTELKNFWFFMDSSKIHTIGEFKQNLNRIFKKSRKANYLFSLSIDDHLLPFYEKSTILRDNDTIRSVILY